MVSWPEFFPPDCPDYDAEDVSGEIYCLTKGKKPVPSDFDPQIIRCRSRQPVKEAPCQASGLSVSRTIDDCREARRLIKSLKNKFICRANLTHIHGKIKNTPIPNMLENHFTWWIPVSVKDPYTLFQAYEDSERIG